MIASVWPSVFRTIPFNSFSISVIVSKAALTTSISESVLITSESFGTSTVTAAAQAETEGKIQKKMFGQFS